MVKLIDLVTSFYVNSKHVMSISIDFSLKSKGHYPLHGLTFAYSFGDWDDPCDHLNNVL